MGYYNISLTDAAKKVCTITTPLVRYKYNCLPIGFFIVEDIFRDKIRALMEDLEFVRFYLKDFSIIESVAFEEHLAKSKNIMKWLHSDGPKFNIDKWKFAVLKG